MPCRAGFQVTVEDGGNRAHQGPALRGDVDTVSRYRDQPVRRHRLQGSQFRGEGLIQSEVGRLRDGIGLQPAHQPFDDGAPEPVVGAQLDAANDGKTARADGAAPAAERGLVLHIPFSQAADGRGPETEQGAGLVRGVALEIPPEAAFVEGDGKGVAGLGEMVEADGSVSPLTRPRRPRLTPA